MSTYEERLTQLPNEFLDQTSPTHDPGGLTVIQVLPTPDTITIVAISDAGTAACPSCGGLSQRVHSTYQRQLQDLPWQGRAVVIQVRARRFRCPDPTCARRTFVERFRQGSRQHGWSAAFRPGIAPALICRVDGDAVSGMQVGGGD